MRGYSNTRKVAVSLRPTVKSKRFESFTHTNKLVSGFSPALLTNLLGGRDMTPLSMMMSVIGSERYAVVTA